MKRLWLPVVIMAGLLVGMFTVESGRVPRTVLVWVSLAVLLIAALCVWADERGRQAVTLFLADRVERRARMQRQADR